LGNYIAGLYRCIVDIGDISYRRLRQQILYNISSRVGSNPYSIALNSNIFTISRSQILAHVRPDYGLG